MIRWKFGLPLLEAEVLKGMLQANGIPSLISNAYSLALQPSLEIAGAGAAIWLDALDQPAADRLLSDWAPREDEGD